MTKRHAFHTSVVLALFLFCGTAYAAGDGSPTQVEEEDVAAAVRGEREKTDDELLIDAGEKYRKTQRVRRRIDNQAKFEEFMESEITPGQVKAIRRRDYALEEAAQLPVPGRGSQRSQAVSLEPGAKNPIVRCYPQYATIIRVLDSEGNPWPIQAYMIGNSSQFRVQKPDAEPFDTIIVSPLVNAGSTNLAIILDNSDGENPVPPLSVQIVVSPGYGDRYDSVASIRVDRRGPRAAPVHAMGGGGAIVDDVMLAFLGGVPPKNALQLKTSDKTVEAWEYADTLYVRTRKKIVWPAWQQTISSERDGGVHVYALSFVPSVVLSGNRSVSIGRYPQAVTRAMEGK